MTALWPAFLLLAWSVIAATAAAGFVAAPLLGLPVAALGSAPRRPRTGMALLLALLGYPLLYAIGFAVLGEANLFTGIILGALHALTVLLLTIRHGGRELVRAHATRPLLYLVYGSVLGFTFLIP